MLGQSDAILRTRDVCRDDALILFPDALFEADFAGLHDLDVDGVAYTKEIDDPSAYGVAVLDGGRITRLVEKPSEPISNLALIGIYYFKHVQELYAAMDDQIARQIKTRGEYFLSDAVEIMVENGKHFITKGVDSWEDCGNADALLQTNRYLLSHASPSPAQQPGSVINHPSFVHREATLENAVIGPYASIGAGSVIRNAVLRDVIVGEKSTVEDVILERSIIGNGVEVSGTAAMINVGDADKLAL
jgi:glucose-1-phosphate thymidylyltransferase